MSKKHHAAKSNQAGPVSQSQRKGRKNRDVGGPIPRSALPWIGAGIVVLVIAAILIFRPKQAVPTEISAAQAYEKYQAGAFFLDVRSQDEWNQGHIEKSALIPLEELPNRLSEVPRNQDVVVVCRSGVRSKEGATILRQAGFTRVMCMTGGL